MSVLDIEKTPEIEKQYRDKYTKPNFLIDHVDLIFDVQDECTEVQSVAHFTADSENKPLVLDGENLELLEIKLNGKELTEKDYVVRQYADDPKDIKENSIIYQKLIIENVPKDFALETKVKIYPKKNKTCMGLYESNGNLTTQCESEGFRKITFFLDRPDVRTIFKTKIIADKRKFPVLLSNGNLKERGELDANRHYVVWYDPHVKPSYLFALVASSMQCIEDNYVTKSNKQVALRVYVPKEDINKASFAMQALKDSMDFDERVYNREYDLEYYNIVGVPNFNMGAMENKGLNIFNNSALLVEPNTGTDNDFKRILTVVSHEYFHNWAGNRVGPLSWFELSLKEGLATAKEREFSRLMTQSVVSRIDDVETLQTVQFAQDAGPMAQPVRLSEVMSIDNLYTTTTYYKGAELLHMLAALLGEEVYHKGVSHYFDEYDGKAVTINEFLKSLEEVSGKDLSQFLTWYHQSGTPVLDFSESYDADNKKYSITITQNNHPTSDQSEKQNLLIPVKVALLDMNGNHIDLDGQKEQVLELTEKQQTFTFDNIASKPIMSVLRDFSAPVKIGDTPYTDADWLFLAENDTDEMNQWTSFRTAMLNEYKKVLSGENISENFLSVCKKIVQSDKIEAGLKASMLSTFSFNYLSNQVDIIEPEKLKETSKRFFKVIAESIKEELLTVYEAAHSQSKGEPNFTPEASGNRALKNLAISYLARLEDEKVLSMLKEQLSLSVNMTDTLGAMAPILMNYTDKYPEQSQEILDNFYSKWKKEDLVILKWLQLSTIAEANLNVDKIQKVMEHEAFDVYNPNKVRSLLGPFINSSYFHDKEGKGYQFLKEIILKTDKFNPMLSAGLMTVLTKWQKFAEPYQSLMKKSLEELSGNVSHNVQEFINKSLEGQKKN